MKIEALSGLATNSSWERGLVYASQPGRVTITDVDKKSMRLHGTSRGSGNKQYFISVACHFSPAHTLDSINGVCTCPVAWNCKHCVAIALTGAHLLFSDGAASGMDETSAISAPTDSATWKRTLNQIFTPSVTQSLAPERPLGLRFTFPTDQQPGAAPHRGVIGSSNHLNYGSGASRFRSGSTRTLLRPVILGKREKWIRTGVSWAGLHYRTGDPCNDAHRTALRRIFSLRNAFNNNDYYSTGETLAIEDLNATDFWAALRLAVQAGVTLLGPDDSTPVILEEAPVRAEIEIEKEKSGALNLNAGMTHPHLLSSTRSTQLGDPAHGIVWREPEGFHLAPFELPVPQGWAQLSRETKGVTVPSEDVPDFLLTVMPHISSIGWTSPNHTFDPPPPPAPSLHLQISLATPTGPSAAPRAHLRWSWHYRNADGIGRGPLPLYPKPYDSGRDSAAEQEILSQVAQALQVVPAELSDTDLVGLQVVTLAQDVVPSLRDLGVTVQHEALPDYRQAAPPIITLGIDQEHTDRDWLGLQVTVLVEDKAVPLASLIEALVQEEDLLFLPNGTYVSLSNPELEQLRHLLDEARSLTDQRHSGIRVPNVRISWWEELLGLGIVQTATNSWFDKIRAAITDPPASAPLPAGLDATLRDYQLVGFQWLAGLRRSGLGGVLADDMGLGKTVQTLAMIADEREHPSNAGEGLPWLVVAPTSVVSNWAAEAKRFTPDLRVATIDATETRRGIPLREIADGVDAVITSFALLRLEAEEYAGISWAGMVIDEAQNAKNHTAKVFAALMGVGAPATYAITGTPMENHLGELWSMFALVAPGLLGSPKQFRESFRKPIEGEQDPDGQIMARLRRRIAPFLLRRSKSGVSLELPEKQEQLLQVTLSAGHRRVYDRHLQRERQKMLGLIDDLNHNQIEILAALTRLRQLAIDPALVEPDNKTPSSKTETLIPLLQEAADEGHRVVVFSQFTRYLRRIAARLEAEGLTYSYLDGTTPRRQAVIDKFRQGTDPVFLMSLKAGGVGINLTEADYAILIDPWWNPAVESQAIARTHRIGQTRPVHVYRLVATDTIEQKMLALQDTKRALAGALLAEDDEGAPGKTKAGGSKTGGAGLNADDLRSLFG